MPALNRHLLAAQLFASATACVVAFTVAACSSTSSDTTHSASSSGTAISSGTASTSGTTSPTGTAVAANDCHARFPKYYYVGPNPTPAQYREDMRAYVSD